MDKDEQKAILKEAVQEWLDEKLATFGKWSMAAIAAFIFATVIALAIQAGWKPV